MSAESDIIAYRHKKQTEKMRRFREIYQQQKDAEAKRPAKESKYVKDMRKKIAEEIRRIEEDRL